MGAVECETFIIKRLGSTYTVVAEQRGEVGSLERVYGVNELGAVERVGLSEDAAREQAELHEARHGLVLGGLGGARGEPSDALAL